MNKEIYCKQYYDKYLLNCDLNCPLYADCEKEYQQMTKEEKIQQLVNDILSSQVEIRNSDCYIIAETLLNLKWDKK